MSSQSFPLTEWGKSERKMLRWTCHYSPCERLFVLIRYFEQLKKSALAQSLLITALCVVVYWIGPISTYETNDDVYLSLVFSGKLLVSTPDPHVVFVNFALAQVFARLYAAIPAIPWFGIFQIGSILLSVFFLNYCFSVTRIHDKFLMRMAISLASAVPFLFLIQYTKTAVALAVTGYLSLYLLHDSSFRSRMNTLFLHAIAVSFLLVSFSLRKESFFLATILCGFLVINALMKRRITLIISLSAGVILIVVFTLVHKQNYGAEWQDFYEVKKVTEDIIDYDKILYNSNEDLFSKAGLSKNDYDFLESWGYADGRIYSKERLTDISRKSNKQSGAIAFLPALMMGKSFPAKHYILTMACLTLLTLLYYRQRYSFLFLCVLLPFIACAGILAWQGRFPPRVSTAMVYFLPWAIIVLSGDLRQRLPSMPVAVVTLLLLAASAHGQFQDLFSIAQYRLIQNQDLHRLGVLVSRRPITQVVLGSSYPFGGILPFESTDYLSGTPIVWFSSGLNQSPLQKKQLAELHIDDIFSSLINGSETYMVIKPVLTSTLQRYIYEHYQKKIVGIPAYSGKSLTMYRLMTVNTSITIPD